MREDSERPEALETALRDRDLSSAWAEYQGWDDPDDDFVSIAEDVTGDSVTMCDDCGDPEWMDNATSIDNGSSVVCELCLDNYSRCCDCEEWYHDDSMRYHDSNYWCECCFYDSHEYCEECDEWYHNDEGHDTSHEDEQCDCEAPHLRFTFPANGHGVIRQDERLTVELPAGTIDDEGIGRIVQLVNDALLGTDWSSYRWEVRHIVDKEEVGSQWQTKRGNFTRRLSSALYNYKGAKIKLPDGVLSQIGNVAREHSSKGSEWHVEVTRDLNQSAGDFYHEGSCWWGGYSYSRCALKQWGGIGLRTFSDSGYVSGRAWVQPLRRDGDKLVPTHRTTDADAYVVYNGYGDLSGYAGTRIVAHLTSLSYKKVNLYIDRQYVNGNSGYLVADEATCQSIDKLQFDHDEHSTLDAHECHERMVG